MNVAIWSQFRDDAGEYIENYFARIDSLDWPAARLRLYLTEGDSTDKTREQLQERASQDGRVRVFSTDTGLPRLDHTPRPERMKCLAQTARKGWDQIALDGWADWVLMLESDLIYSPDLLKRLTGRKPQEADVYAPMIWMQSPEKPHPQFYDIWAYRTLDGRMFRPLSPAWFNTNFPGEAFEVGSVGSVVLFRAAVIEAGARLSEQEAIVGCCKWGREQGYRIFVDPQIHVIHPPVEVASLQAQWRRVELV